MRRISLALALVGAVAAAGCGGAGNTGSSPTGSTGDKGVAQGTFTVTVQNGQNSPAGNDTLKIKGGRVVSTPAGIDCGVTIDAATLAAVAHESCSATFAAGAPVTLEAQAATTIDRGYDADYAFRGWAGDCAGDTNPCTVADAANKADRYVVASFAGGMTGHPNYTDPSVHGPLVAPSCASCHGTNFQGQGLAVGCNQCHNATSQIATAATGLDVVIDSVSATAPITVNFRLLDKAGAYVDVTGANTTALPTGARWSASKNQPVSITMALVKYGEANGNVLPYKSFDGVDPATVNVYAPQGDKTSGTATTGSQGGVACTPTAPCTCSRSNACTNAVVYTTGTQDGRACTTINPCVCNAKHPCGPALAATSAAGALTFNPATGLYTYVFSTPAAYPADLDSQHVALWTAAYRQENVLTAFDAKRYTAVNKGYVVPVGLPAVDRQIVTVATCARCHDGFPAEAKADGSGWAGFHSGARINPEYCNICHFDARRAGAADGGADSKSFIHRIHSAEHAGAPTTAWYHNTAGVNGIAVTYPQDPRNCRECHPDTAQGNQFKTRPSKAACVGCHYNVSFAATAPTGTVAHTGGAQADDTGCATADCHPGSNIERNHIPVVAKDANNILDTVGGNSRTNAGAMVAAGATLLPAGADRITAEIGTVSVVADGAVFRPRMTFKLKRNGTDVQFNTAPATPPTTWTADELITDFTGSPAVYFAWSVPQDGIATPADFNTSANIPLKQIWLGTGLTGTKAATLTGPDGSGFYTVTFTGVQIAENAQYLTGGVGYAYDLPATQPLTQTNLVDTYPTTDRNVTSGAVYGITCSATTPCTFKTGGLIVPMPNVWKAAGTGGFVARRAIVSNDRCNNCHAFLGVAPNFHVGQRNDGPTCSFCHTPNRTSSGWSANSKDFIHGIHGAKWRTQGFNWHAGSCPTGTTFTRNTAAGTNLNGGWCRDNTTGAAVTPSPWYPGVEFPGSKCTDCHEPGTYDFSAPASAAAVGSLLPSTVATGTLSASISTSPYVTLGTAYGSGFGYATDTGVITAPAGTTLVTSPITAACFACHDSAASVAHFRANGGKVYAPRSGGSFLAANETCLTCHGPAGISPIGKVHR